MKVNRPYDFAGGAFKPDEPSPWFALLNRMNRPLGFLGYVHNLQGDVVAIVDGSGNHVVEYTYDAWGKPLTKTGDMANTLGTLNPFTFRYRGYVFDEETGLYYLRSRYYNPVWGRYINSDGYGGAVSQILSHNVYAYCKNNHVCRCDPSGQYDGSAVKNYANSYGNQETFLLSPNTEMIASIMYLNVLLRAGFR